MQPQNPPTKPVMDVAAPRHTSPPAPAAPASQPEAMAVRPAPAGMPLRPAVAAAGPRVNQRASSQAVAPAGAPVGLITATILVMLVLAGVATIIYVTAQSA